MKRFILSKSMLCLFLLGMVCNVAWAQTICPVEKQTAIPTDGYYVIYSESSSGSGWIYYDKSQSERKFRVGTDVNLSNGVPVNQTKYIWKLQNGSDDTFTLQCLNEGVYIPADAGANQNMNGTTTANLKLTTAVNEGEWYISQTNYKHSVSGQPEATTYIHTNTPTGYINLSYWPSTNPTGTSIRAQFYKVDIPTAYKPGERTTTLTKGKKYFIGAATYYNNARYNLLYNKNGSLTYSNNNPSAIVTDDYLFTVEDVGDNNTYFIKNSSNKYLQSGNLASTEEKTPITVVQYNSVKGTVTCTQDVQACDEKGNKIEYNNITNETPIVCVYADNDNGWRHINGLEIGKSTPFAFYEATEVIIPFPELTTDVTSPKLYTIKNLRANKYATYNGTTRSMSLKSSVDNIDGLFYFTAGENGTYKIHNMVTSNKCASPNSWTADGNNWYIKKSENVLYTGVAISTNSDLTIKDAWNDSEGKGKSVALWDGNDDGSVWSITEFDGDASTYALKTSTTNAENLYFIKNIRSNKYANFVARETQFTQNANTGYGSYWYFVEKTDAQNVPFGFKACYIYNAACNLPVENPSLGKMEAVDATPYPGKIYYVGTYEHENQWGYVMYDPKDADNTGWNDKDESYVTNYDPNDAGSLWSLIPADKTATQLKDEASTVLTNAKKYIADAEEADFYTYSDNAIATAKETIEGVDVSTLDAAVSSLLNGTISDPMTTLQATEKGSTNPAAGQYILLKNRSKKQYMTTMTSGNDVHRTSDATDLKVLWQVVEGENGVKLYNPVKNLYMGPLSKSAKVQMVSEADAQEFVFTNQAEVYGVFQNVGGDQHTFAHMDGWYDRVVGWEAASEASQWIISEVTLEETLADLQTLCDDVESAFGDKVGQYKMVQDFEDGLYVSLSQAKDAIESTGAKDVYTIRNLSYTLKINWNDFVANPTSREINLPVEGNFYRIKNNSGSGYLNGNGTSGRVQFNSDNSSANSVFYYDGTKLLSYATGLYLGLGEKNNNFVCYTTTVGEAAGTTFAFSGAPALGKFLIAFKDTERSFYSANENSDAADKGQTGDSYRFTVEEVETLPVTITDAGYATLYAPVALKIHENVKVYIAGVNDEKTKLVLQEITDVIPQNTGVILEGAKGTYDFEVVADDEPINGNKLTGSYAKSEKNPNADVFTLQNGDYGVGFYLFRGENAQGAKTYINGFRSWLELDANSQVKSFRFDFGSTTDIENLLNTQDSDAIYDLYGRRVENMDKGIYIVNGKKVVIK